MRFKAEFLLDPRFPSVSTVGFATQRFQRFVNPAPDMHDHEFVELFFILDGSADHHIGEQVLEAGPGTLGVVHFGQQHAIVTPRGPIDVMNIYINPSAAPLPALEAPLSNALPRILPLSPGLSHNQNRAIQYRFPDPTAATTMLTSMDREANTRAPGWQDAMRLWMKLFLIECARLILEQEPPEPGDLPPAAATLERLRRHLDEHFTEPVKLDTLAKKAHISKAYLCRAFRRHTGRTVLEYVHQRRVEKAMVLLDSTELRVVEVAAQCGFHDLSHFNRIFRRVAGVTPSGFRARELAAAPAGA